MILTAKLYKFLASDEKIRVFVSSSGQSKYRASGIKIFPLIAPEETVPPYIVFTKASEVAYYTLGGCTQTASRRMQISVYDSDVEKANEISGIIFKKLDMWSEEEPLVQAVTRISQAEMYDKESGLTHVATDYTVYGQL
jgi:hypothetical protein